MSERKYDPWFPVQVTIGLLDDLESIHVEAPVGVDKAAICRHCSAQAQIEDLRKAIVFETDSRRKQRFANKSKLN